VLAFAELSLLPFSWSEADDSVELVSVSFVAHPVEDGDLDASLSGSDSSDTSLSGGHNPSIRVRAGATGRNMTQVEKVMWMVGK
jgi:hypothetical protein